MSELMSVLTIEGDLSLHYERKSDVSTQKLKEFYFYAVTRFVIHKNVKDITLDDARYIYDALSFMNEVASFAHAGSDLKVCPPIAEKQLEAKEARVAIGMNDQGQLIFLSEDRELKPMHMLVVIACFMGVTLDLLDRTDIFEQLIETGFVYATMNEKDHI